MRRRNDFQENSTSLRPVILIFNVDAKISEMEFHMHAPLATHIPPFDSFTFKSPILAHYRSILPLPQKYYTLQSWRPSQTPMF